MVLSPILLVLALIDPAGWYTVDGREMLLTYSAKGGYQLIDFEMPSMTPVQDGKTVDGRFILATGKRSKDPAYSVREISFTNGGVKLSGTLFLAKGKGPTAVLIHGSGDSDRDGFWYLEHAHALASQGVNVLLPDKRGCGKSGGNWRTSSFADYAADAITGAKALGSLGLKRIGFVGLSQGGWISPLAASLWNEAAFVVNISSAAVTPAEQVDHEMANTFREMGLTGEDFERAQMLQRLAGDVVRKDEWRPYDLYRQELLGGKLKALAEGFPGAPDHWMWNWYRRNGSFDVLPVIEGLSQPVMIVYGRKDEHDNVPVSTSVEMLTKAGKRKKGGPLSIKVYGESGHGIGDPSTGRVSREHLTSLAVWIVKALE